MRASMLIFCRFYPECVDFSKALVETQKTSVFSQFSHTNYQNELLKHFVLEKSRVVVPATISETVRVELFDHYIKHQTLPKTTNNVVILETE